MIIRIFNKNLILISISFISLYFFNTNLVYAVLLPSTEIQSVEQTIELLPVTPVNPVAELLAPPSHCAAQVAIPALVHPKKLKNPASDYDMIELPSENFGCNANGKGRGELHPSLLIAHCMGTEFVQSIDLLTKSVENGGGGVSAHYFVPQLTGREIQEQHPEYLNGIHLKYPDRVPVFKLVKDEDRSWHAGMSRWGDYNQLPGCSAGLNSCSIGIEFHSPGYAKGDGSNWYKFGNYSNKQLKTGRHLIRDIYNKWNIKKSDFLGHLDITPQRKTDPGLNFPWEKFAKHGFGQWWMPATEIPAIAEKNRVHYVQMKLKEIGYDCPETGIHDETTRKVISAFRMHFMQTTWKDSEGKEDDGLLNGSIDEPLILMLAGYSVIN